ncbi:hypothetical protein [Psychrobacter fjordensis]|uniref:hypothetical protein n=1 Tax=Psychrobacter fjordensis TaxID=664424 RepID=UPI00223434C8|nr:hypothetical protein [Psychrobacter fjordensis]
MQKRTLPLSLLIGAALTLPSLAMAAPANMKPVDMQKAAADSAMQANVESAEGEIASAESSPFQISETQTISIARTNSNAGMATQVEDMQQPGMQQPDMQQPDMQQPDVQQPDMQQPDMQQPDMQQPDMQQPDMQQPDMQQSDMQQPIIR